MIVNKCDNCNVDFEEGQYPEWFQLTAERGIIILNSHNQATKCAILDFCCPSCMSDFFTKLAARMSEAACQSKNE